MNGSRGVQINYDRYSTIVQEPSGDILFFYTSHYMIFHLKCIILIRQILYTSKSTQ